MIITDVAIGNRTTVGVLVLLIVVVGAFSYVTVPRESAPDVPIPIVIVTTTYEGVSPEDVETAVTLKIETKLAGLKGVKELRSASAEGVSIITIEFLPDVEVDDAVQYVRDKVDQAKGELPVEAEDPTITEVNVAEFPIMMVNISGDISPVRVKAIADELEDVIEEIPGVLGVDVLGALEREIRLEIDPDRIGPYGFTVGELLALVPSENVNISAGGLDTPKTKFNVRVPAEFVGPEDVDHLVLAVRDGKPIYLSDIATIRDTFKDRVGISRLDGRDTITLSIQKRTGENIIAITDRVQVVLAEARKRVPAGVKLVVTLDQSKDIRMMIADLENNIASGLVLVVVVLFLFLGFRSSMIVALAIPMSMLISFGVILGLGYTMNMVVLFSLILALGMLVDNAIVIVENIYRHVQLGYGRREASMKGTAEVAWPVITSTATTVVAFAPMIFWPGIMGEFMKYLPITVIIVLVSSLFVAMVINPTVCSLLIGGKGAAQQRRGWFVGAYERVLTLALHHRLTTLLLAVILLAGVGEYYMSRGHGVELFPAIDPKRGVINIRSPQGTDIRESDRIARIVEERVLAYADDVEYLVTNVGSSGGGGQMFGGSVGGPHIANLTVLFHDFEVRPRKSADVIAEIREDLSDLAGAEIKVEKQKEGPPTGAAVAVRVIGRDFRMLEEISERARRAIINVPGLVNLRSDHTAAKPELAFHVDRQRAMLLGVNTAMVGNFLKTAVFGNKVGTYRQFNDEYDITIRLPPDQRVSIEDMFRLRIPNVQGHAVPLSSLGKFEYTGGLGTIRRVNQKRVVTLTGDAEGRQGEEVLADVEKIIAGLELPAGYEIRYAGEKEEQDKAQAFLSKAFVMALLLVVLIIVAQFNTLSVPFIIMTTVVLSLVGVLSGLLICEMPFGIIMTGVGVISLAGVVVNNAIVLLDYTRQLQHRGMGLLEAAIEAGCTRLRPVLLTATTTILGLIPMATGVSFDFHVMRWATRSESSQWWASMAIAVIFGLAFATVLTLVVVPALYVTLHGAAARLGFHEAAATHDPKSPG